MFFCVLLVINPVYLFIDPKTDPYIARCLRELISLYFPKILVGIKSSDELPLLKFFEERPDNEIPERVLLLELLVSTFLSKRHRTPDSSVAQVYYRYHKLKYYILLIMFYLQVLEYINSIIKINFNNKLVILSIIQHTLMRICSVSMFCEETNICKRISNEIINTFINLSVSHSNEEIKYTPLIIFCCYLHVNINYLCLEMKSFHH